MLYILYVYVQYNLLEGGLWLIALYAIFPVFFSCYIYLYLFISHISFK